MDNLAILVNTCDDYSDVWELFIRCLEEHCPDCKLPIYFNTETFGSLPFETSLAVKFVNSEGAWGKRLLSSLGQIKEDFIINLFDDYLLEEPLLLAKIDQVLEILTTNSFVSAVYLNAVSLRYHRNIPKAGFREVKNYTEYRLNSAPGIWRKGDLAELTHENDSPWSWEVFGTYRTFKSSKCFLSPSSACDNIYAYQYKKGGAIYRGKWVSDVIDEKIAKYNLGLEPKERGYTDSLKNEKRSLLWKYNFIVSGFKTDGLKAFWYLIFYVRNKVGL
jgi:hypothetical protein